MKLGSYPGSLAVAAALSAQWRCIRSEEEKRPEVARIMRTGVSTIRQYLKAQLIDELHLAVAPALLGAGENLFEGLNLPALGHRVVRHVASEAAMHVTIERR